MEVVDVRNEIGTKALLLPPLAERGVQLTQSFASLSFVSVRGKVSQEGAFSSGEFHAVLTK